MPLLPFEGKSSLIGIQLATHFWFFISEIHRLAVKRTFSGLLLYLSTNVLLVIYFD
jgi:hypothetical protein